MPNVRGRMSEKETAVMVGVILLLILVTAASAQDGQPEPGKELYRTGVGPCSVDTVKSITLHDVKRDKDLQLRVSYPKEAGEYPVIVWSHGATGTKDMYDPIITHWVSHGYVIIQANHSDSRAFGQKGQMEVFRDWASRPKDVAFILDSLDEIEKKAEALRNKMDKKTIGVGGHSFGAHTAQLVGGVTTVDPFSKERVSHADKRPKAFVLLSPQGTGEMLDEDSWKSFTRPAIVITGSKDPGRKGEPYTWRLEPFKYAPPGDKFLLFIEGAHHGFGTIPTT
jgi:dienelactone hydrolase